MVRGRTGHRRSTGEHTWRRLLRAVIVLVLVLGVAACGDSSVSKDEQARAVAGAKAAYESAKAQGTDFSNGPCIAEQLRDLPDWSVDVAHDPREDVDDQSANQCQDYRQGKTHHFVELDPSGNLIRTH